MTLPVTTLNQADLASLRAARALLETPSLAVRLSSVLGVPIERGLRLLPRDWSARVNRVTERAVLFGLEYVARDLDRQAPRPSRQRLDRLLATVSGAVGGLMGPLTLLAELPLATGLMLRSIADIARNEGEDLSVAEARLACLQVFALGGDLASDGGYYELRVALALHVSGQRLITGKAVNLSNIPGGVALTQAVARRFGAVVSDATAARMLPLAGAVSGAMVNLLFMQHFQSIARGHFTVRRLERRYGQQAVRAAYQRLDTGHA
jgi:hypothetical protein